WVSNVSVPSLHDSFFANSTADRSNMNTPQPKELDPMTTDSQQVFLQIVSVALAQLKQRLQRDYELAYPELREIIHLVLDEEEARAWDLTLFPHLLLPDLVQVHVAQLNLRPVEAKHADVFATRAHDQFEINHPVFALCA